MTAESNPVTVPWLQDEIRELLKAAKDAEEIDHQSCIQYLNLLFKTIPELDREAPAAAPAGKAIRDNLWREQSDRRNGKAP